MTLIDQFMHEMKHFGYSCLYSPEPWVSDEDGEARMRSANLASMAEGYSVREYWDSPIRRSR